VLGPALLYHRDQDRNGGENDEDDGFAQVAEKEIDRAGAKQERERVASIRAVVPPGFDALAETLIADGSTPDQAAHAVCAAVREQGVAAARANAAGVIPPLAFVASTTSEEEAKAKDPDSIDPHELSRRILEIQAANPSMNTLAAAAEARKSFYGA
jgi:hypothetical protein